MLVGRSIRWLRARVRDFQLQRLRAQGLQIEDDCRIMGFPAWGGEPYLISIGHRVTIASGVVFITHDGATWVFRRDKRYENVIRYGRIVIHDDSFIGHSAILMPGVEIGPRSVVASGAVVAESVPPNTVVAGVPAKAIMSVDDYAERLRQETPQYDPAEYQSNKKRALEKLYPRPW